MKKTKIFLVTIMLVLILILPSTINAMYQSIPQLGTAWGVAGNLFINVRKMEAAGQVMGLTETLVNDNTPQAGSTSNNIDVHMMKNTEYGGIVMLAASQYGAVQAGTVNDIGTARSVTTSNPFGIYQMADGRYEHLASIYGDVNTSNYPNVTKLKAATLNNATKRYVDNYTNPGNSSSNYEGAKVGDATKETAMWYGAPSSTFVMPSLPVFMRGSKAAFYFYFNYDNGRTSTAYGARAVAVCGVGL